MGKEKNKQKPNEKKKPQHSLKEKRQAKKEKAEGKSPSIWWPVELTTGGSISDS